MSRLAGKVAIVTGTSANIGGGIAQGLADEGARVVCVDVAEDNARQCADWIAKRGGTSLGIACDVTDEGQVEAMVGRVRSEERRVGKECEARGSRGPIKKKEEEWKEGAQGDTRMSEEVE